MNSHRLLKLNDVSRVLHQWSNRGRDVVVRLIPFNGQLFVDLRIFYRDDEGILRPSTKGLRLSLDHCVPLIKALRRARKVGGAK